MRLLIIILLLNFCCTANKITPHKYIYHSNENKGTYYGLVVSKPDGPGLVFHGDLKLCKSVFFPDYIVYDFKVEGRAKRQWRKYKQKYFYALVKFHGYYERLPTLRNVYPGTYFIDRIIEIEFLEEIDVKRLINSERVKSGLP